MERIGKFAFLVSIFLLAVFVLTAPETAYETAYATHGGIADCQDAEDNDGDGDIDWPDDWGCPNSIDNDEWNAECFDGEDNDGDGLTDHPADPGCTSKTDNNEFNAASLEPWIRVRSNNGGVSWDIRNRNTGTIKWSGSGTAANYNNAQFNVPYDLTLFNPGGATCTPDAWSRTIQNTPGNNDKTFNITCTPTGPSLPTVDMTCSTDGVNFVQGPCMHTAGIVRWTSTNINGVPGATCTTSATPLPSAWDGQTKYPPYWSGTETIEVIPAGTSKTYTMTCSNSAGAVSDSVIVNGICSATAPTGLSTTLITSNSARLNWTPGTGGTRQMLRVGPNQADVLSGCAGGTCVVVENSLVTSLNNYQISAGTLQPSTLYYWRIVNFSDPGTCWSEGNSSFTTLANVAPTTSNVKSAEPDYCTVGPSINASWTYSDPEGTPQRAYQVQVDDNAGFSSPNFDSGTVLGTTTTYYVSSGMTWDTTYRLRVRTWDTPDLPSAWTIQSLCTGPPGNPSGCSGDQKSWKSPRNQYPNNVNTFTWTPARPPVDEAVQFDDGNTACYKTPPNTPDTCLRWDWTWGDGTPGINQQNPTHIYTNYGAFTVTLRAQDQQNGYACSASKTINVQRPIPNWREVLPW